MRCVDKSGFMAVADLAAHIPMHIDSSENPPPSRPTLSSPSSYKESALYFDDGCHFTPAGYEKFGHLVFNTIMYACQ